MARNLLVINCDLRETRVALIEEGVIAELQIERASARSTVGNVVLGRVTRVLPGMQAAFIDVGMDRAAFLHVEDLIRPADFEAYLHGAARDEDAEPSLKGEGGGKRHLARMGIVDEVEGADDDDDADDDAPAGAKAEASDTTDDDDDDDDTTETGEQPVLDSSAPVEQDSGVDESGTAAAESEDAEEDDEDDEDAPINPPSAEVAEAGPTGALRRVEVGSEDSAARSRGRRRRRRRRDGRLVPEPEAKRANGAAPRAARRTGRGQSPLRVSRSVPITEVVKEGDQVIVQISKEPIGTKGARVTSHVSLPGRYVVYLPTVDHIGISKRIGSARERARLRKVIETIKPKTGGLIVRTVAEGLTKKNLKADIGYLIKLWSDIAKNRETAKAPEILYTELDLVLRTARDLFTDDIEKIVIDDREQYARLCRFIEMFMPSRLKDIELYSDDEPIFDAYGIEDEIGRALSRKVPLESGGYLIIDQAEALTAIDVNTGRYVGKGSKDLEETALKTNLEAVDEIAYQLRFRNIGGLVILDLIDMDAPGNREKVWRALEQKLAKDKAKTTLNRISELGLIEMTRKRTRESLSRTMHEPCFYCDGTGQIQARTTIAYEILRQIRRERQSLPGYVVVVNAHPAVVDLMTGDERAAVTEAERRYMRRIEFNPRREYHIEQFDLQGK